MTKHHTEQYEQSTDEGHKAKLSHEIAAGAVSYLAMKSYNEHQEKNGQPVEHAKAKEFLAAAGGALLDGLFESKGLDLIDDMKAKANKHHDKERY